MYEQCKAIVHRPMLLQLVNYLLLCSSPGAGSFDHIGINIWVFKKKPYIAIFTVSDSTSPKRSPSSRSMSEV